MSLRWQLSADGQARQGIEDRMENIQADSFARDYHITAELAGKKDGKLRRCIMTVADRLYRCGGEPVQVSPDFSRLYRVL
jgi:hypothetical protein